MPRPRILVLTLIAGALAAAAVAVPRLAPPAFHGTDLGAAAGVRDFSLEAAGRGPVSLADFRDRVVLLFFGYTSCPDVCPLTMAKLAEVMELVGEGSRDVQVLLVSVDPAVDSPERLRDYAERFHPTFMGLAGDRATLAETARAFGAYAGEPEPPAAAGGDAHEGHAGHGPDPDPATAASGGAARIIPHTAHVFGIDRDGRFRLLWSPDLTAGQIAEDVRTLLRL